MYMHVKSMSITMYEVDVPGNMLFNLTDDCHLEQEQECL